MSNIQRRGMPHIRGDPVAMPLRGEASAMTEPKPEVTPLTDPLSLPITDPRHIPLAIGPVRLGPTPEQLAATMPIIEFYDTPWWRRVLNGLFKR
jgi:hypothetical protein